MTRQFVFDPRSVGPALIEQFVPEYAREPRPQDTAERVYITLLPDPFATLTAEMVLSHVMLCPYGDPEFVPRVLRNDDAKYIYVPGFEPDQPNDYLYIRIRNGPKNQLGSEIYGNTLFVYSAAKLYNSLIVRKSHVYLPGTRAVPTREIRDYLCKEAKTDRCRNVAEPPPETFRKFDLELLETYYVLLKKLFVFHIVNILNEEDYNECMNYAEMVLQTWIWDQRKNVYSQLRVSADRALYDALCVMQRICGFPLEVIAAPRNVRRLKTRRIQRLSVRAINY